MLRTFIQTLSFLLGAAAAVLIIQSTCKLNAQRILALMRLDSMGPRGGQVKSLAEQAAYSCVGISLLLASVLLQLVNTFWTPSFDDLTPNPYGALLGLAVSVVVGFGAYQLAKWWADQTVKKVTRLAEAEAREQETGQESHQTPTTPRRAESEAIPKGE